MDHKCPSGCPRRFAMAGYLRRRVLMTSVDVIMELANASAAAVQLAQLRAGPRARSGRFLRYRNHEFGGRCNTVLTQQAVTAAIFPVRLMIYVHPHLNTWSNASSVYFCSS